VYEFWPLVPKFRPACGRGLTFHSTNISYARVSDLLYVSRDTMKNESQKTEQEAPRNKPSLILEIISAAGFPCKKTDGSLIARGNNGA